MVTRLLDGDGAMGMGMGMRRRRRGADTSYQRDDDVARPSTEQSTRRGMVGWYSVVSVANPFGVGGSGGGVLAPWWSFHSNKSWEKPLAQRRTAWRERQRRETRRVQHNYVNLYDRCALCS